jgi:hypothetical protein
MNPVVAQPANSAPNALPHVNHAFSLEIQLSRCAATLVQFRRSPDF